MTNTMETSTNDAEADPWGLRQRAIEIGGWSWMFFEANASDLRCECCHEMTCGCLCEGSMLNYEVGVAQQALKKAQEAQTAWFNEHRKPAIDAHAAEMEREWRRTQRQARREQRYWARRRAVEAAAVEARLAEREKMRRLERRVARLGDRGGTLPENDDASNEEVEVVIDENEAENEGEWE